MFDANSVEDRIALVNPIMYSFSRYYIQIRIGYEFSANLAPIIKGCSPNITF